MAKRSQASPNKETYLNPLKQASASSDAADFNKLL